MSDLPAKIEGLHFYLIGIKGTGMAAMAELLCDLGAVVTGSDGAERFYTDDLLKARGIPYFEEFDPAHISSDIDFVLFSAAYGEEHAERKRAAELNVPCFSYAEMLGLFSRRFFSVGIAGVHGKTTTTAMAGTLAAAADLPFSLIVGSTVASLGGRASCHRGETFLIAETCEYRRHFRFFSPDVVVLTSVEADHLDYFKDYEDIRSAFVDYLVQLPEGGRLIYCADDRGTRETLKIALEKRPDLRPIPYGTTAEGAFRILPEEGPGRFRLSGYQTVLELKVPGFHSILDAAAAAAVVSVLCEEQGSGLSAEALRQGLANFRGTRRRAEILGEKDGVLYIDDYGHHPTAIKTTLEGLKAFYPRRRLIVDFMSHTYSRTAALLEEFASSFGAADQVLLHKIYASARETFSGKISGRDLFRETGARHPSVVYLEEPEEAVPYLKEHLRPGDLLVTMGAGNNWIIGRQLLDER